MTAQAGQGLLGQRERPRPRESGGEPMPGAEVGRQRPGSPRSRMLAASWPWGSVSATPAPARDLRGPWSLYLECPSWHPGLLRQGPNWRSGRERERAAGGRPQGRAVSGRGLPAQAGWVSAGSFAHRLRSRTALTLPVQTTPAGVSTGAAPRGLCYPPDPAASGASWLVSSQPPGRSPAGGEHSAQSGGCG